MTLLKRTIKNSMQGIGIACTLYLLFGMISDQHNHGCFVLENWLFTKQAIGTILVGIAFSAPTEIYHSNRLPCCRYCSIWASAAPFIPLSAFLSAGFRYSLDGNAVRSSFFFRPPLPSSSGSPMRFIIGNWQRR